MEFTENKELSADKVKESHGFFKAIEKGANLFKIRLEKVLASRGKLHGTSEKPKEIKVADILKEQFNDAEAAKTALMGMGIDNISTVTLHNNTDSHIKSIMADRENDRMLVNGEKLLGGILHILEVTFFENGTVASIRSPFYKPLSGLENIHPAFAAGALVRRITFNEDGSIKELIIIVEKEALPGQETTTEKKVSWQDFIKRWKKRERQNELNSWSLR